MILCLYIVDIYTIMHDIGAQRYNYIPSILYRAAKKMGKI